MGKTILFSPMDSHGHVNSCIGVGQVLLARGHRVVFAIDAAWKGKLAKYGFEEELIDIGDNTDEKEYWQLIMAQYGDKVLDAEPIDQIELFSSHILSAMFDHHKKAEPKLKEIITRIKPDLIAVDCYICSPAATNSGIPWVRLFSAGPLLVLFGAENGKSSGALTFLIKILPKSILKFFIKNSIVKNLKLPPPNSGLSINEPQKWTDHLVKILTSPITHKIIGQINEWVVSQGAPSLGFTQLHPDSPYLNIYFYPEEIDFLDVIKLPPKWHRFDALIRQSDEVFEIPEKLKNKPGKLIYFSMGSFASSYSPMMKQLVDLLKDSLHRFIVSKGADGDKYDLPDNMWGANFVPQTKVIPLVDLVITHGGNNTITESFYFGKPMIILSLFGDQHDHAQRVQDKGFGIRLRPFRCTQKELSDAIDKLVNDDQLKLKMQGISKRIQDSKSNEKVTDLFEEILK